MFNALFVPVATNYFSGEVEYYVAESMKMCFGPFWIIPGGLLGLGQSDTASTEEDE